jgi:TP901 family phage tail tape measure protein
MSLLGSWVAKIIVDIGGVGTQLSKASSEFDKYTAHVKKKQEELDKYTKSALETTTGYRAKDNKEAIQLTDALTKKELKDLEKKKAEYLAFYTNQEKRVKDFRTSILKWASVAISIPIIIGTKKALDDFMEFQQEIINVRAVTGATASEMQRLTDNAIGMSTELKFTAKEIASAYLELGQAGYDANEILEATSQVMVLAAAGMQDISFTSELVVTTLKAFNLEASEASRIADVFAASNAKSVSSLDKISASLKYTAGLWASQGWEVENLVGVLGVLYDTGVRGEKAGRMLASAIRSLIKPTASATDEIVKLFGKVDALSPAFNTIEEIVYKLKKVGASQAEITKIFGKESSEIMTRLVTNSEAIQSSIEGVTNQLGEATRQAAMQNTSLKAQAQILGNTFQKVGLNIVEYINPAIVKVLNALKGMVEQFSKFPTWLQTFLSLSLVIGGLSPVIGFASLKIGGMVTALKAATIAGGTFAGVMGTLMPWLLVGSVAIAGIGTAVAYNAKKQQEWNDAVLDSVSALERQSKDIDKMVGDIRELYDVLGDSDEVKKSLQELAKTFPELRNQLNRNADDTATAMKVLNDEYAKLKNIQAVNAGKAVDLSADDVTRQSNQINASIAQNVSELEKARQEYEKMGQDLQVVFSDAVSGGEVSLYTTEELFKVLEKMTNEDIEKWSKGFLHGGAYLTDYARRIYDAQTALISLNSAQNRLKRNAPSVETNIENETTAFQGLYNALKNAFLSMEDMQAPIKLQYETVLKTTGSKEEADKIMSEYLSGLGSTAQKAIDDILNDFPIDMISTGLTEADGSLGTRVANNINFVYEEAQKKINSMSPIDITKSLMSFDASIFDMSAFEKYKQDAIELEKKKDLLSTEDYEKEYFNLNSQLRDAFEVLLAISTLYNTQEGSVKKQADWWETLIGTFETIAQKLQGQVAPAISSLNQKLEELKDGSGGAYEEVKTLATSLQTAFEQNPELEGYIDNVDVFQLVLQKFIQTLTDETLSMAEQAGIIVAVNRGLQNMKTLTATIAQLENQRSQFAKDNKQDEFIIANSELEKQKQALLDLKVSLGLLPPVVADASKGMSDLKKEFANTQQIEQWKQQLKGGTISLENLQQLMSEIGKEETLQGLYEGMTTSINAVGVLDKEVDKLEKELLELENSGATEVEIKAKMKEVDFAKEQKASGVENVYSNVSKFVTKIADITENVGRSFINIVKSVKSFKEGLEGIPDLLISIGNNIGATASTIGDAFGIPIISSIGKTMQAISAMGKLIVDIADLFREDTQYKVDEALLESEMIGKMAQIAQDAENEVKQIMLDFGASVGDTIISGVMQGLSKDEMEKQIRQQLYQIVAKQVILLAGFEDIIAAEAEKMWEAINPNAKTATKLDTQIETIENQLASMIPTNVLQTQIDSLRKSYNELSPTYDKEQRKQLDTQIKILEAQQESYTALSNELDKLTSQREKLGDIELNDDFADQVSENVEGLMEKVSDITDVIMGVADAFDAVDDELAKSMASLSDTIQRSLTEAVLTGSYSDFRKAVYNQIVSQITEAIISASLIKDKVQGIVESIINMGNGVSTEEGRQTIKDQINAINAEIRNAYTYAQDLLQPIRDGLASFGEMEINVNAGQVVTALPSDVQNQLVTAIQSVSENLTKAITEAGLNSYIETVYITTAYISAMEVNNIQMQSAVFNMSGDVVVGSIQGQNLTNWMEDFIEQYLNGVSP